MAVTQVMIQKSEVKFRRLLLQWNKEENKRIMPWKHEKDPYKVWLSEVILQQTRVEQGWAYYEKFIQRYPDVQSLAAARDEDVFKLWEGLGYYSRCRNLLHTSRIITSYYNGVFPDSFEEILCLKGIGDYTASAIVSFCFRLPYAVVDGNVFRVLSRVFGIDKPVDSTTGKKLFKTLAFTVLDKKNPGVYNQAIMDFGATVCKPAPLCANCVMQKICIAYQSGKVLDFPVKEKSVVKKERWFNYFIFNCNGEVYVHQRTQKDIWQHLYEFYLHETPEDMKWSVKTAGNWLQQNLQVTAAGINIQKAEMQTLTHRFVYGYFISINTSQKPESLNGAGLWLPVKKLSEKTFSRFLHQYLNNK